jgi:hypothetical protein
MNWVTKNMIVSWENEWQDMPEYVQKDLEPVKSISVHFETLEDMYAFSVLIGQKLTPKTRCVWYPPGEKETDSKTMEYADEEK